MNFETTISGLPVERRENRKAEPLDAAHARIGELLLAYGSACAAYHFGPEVTAAYQVCMAEIAKQMGVS